MMNYLADFMISGEWVVGACVALIPVIGAVWLKAKGAGIKEATKHIDLSQHQGEHPRIGATDVVPFIPLGATPMVECVKLAQGLGERLGNSLGIPVYLYAEAAARPERRWLPTIRQGEFEGLVSAICDGPDRAPDYGPSRLGSAGGSR